MEKEGDMRALSPLGSLKEDRGDQNKRLLSYTVSPLSSEENERNDESLASNLSYKMDGTIR